MHDQVRFESLRHTIGRRMYREGPGALLNVLHACFQVQCDSKLARRMHETTDNIRIELLQRTRDAMEDLHLSTRPRRHVCELERNVTATNEQNARRKAVQ